MTRIRKGHQEIGSYPESPQLSVVQRWFLAVVTHPDGVEAGVSSADAQSAIPMSRNQMEQMVTHSRDLSAMERISIYANAYYARLLECLGEFFPALKRTLGEDVFNGFAFGYLQRYPSRSYTLNRLGERFPEYLSETRPEDGAHSATASPVSASWPDFLIDLARLELTINEVFDGPGIEGKATLGSSDLEGMSPQRWPETGLRTVPCLRLLRTRFPVNDYYTLARRADEQAQLPVPEPEESFLALTRRDFVVRRHSLTHPEYVLLGALQANEPVHQAIAAVQARCALNDEELAARVGDWFQYCTVHQFFEGLAPP